ncbi:hypothetical protein FQR65_LT08346 [Abscondita terminalis]|nr:hypothetical protein FQR65_LT08346 [Abscondita terminalis]
MTGLVSLLTNIKHFKEEQSKPFRFFDLWLSLFETILYLYTKTKEKKVTLIPGAGIGPELMENLKDVFTTACVPIKFEEIQFNPAEDASKQILKIAKSVKKNQVAIKGNLESCLPNGTIVSRNENLRQELDLFAYIFHCRSYPSVISRHCGVDIVIIRQGSKGEFTLLEHEVVPGVTESLKLMTRQRCERLAKYAFEYARKNKRKKVTTIHKANIMKLTDGMFLETSKKIAKEYSDIEHKEMIVDNCCMQIVSDPGQFDVMLTTNLYGSIIANVLAGLTGGPGLWSAMNHGPNVCNRSNSLLTVINVSFQCAIFEPALRPTGANLVGKGIANPIAMINAGVDLLHFLGCTEHAELISTAIGKTLCNQVFTLDLSGTATTCDVVQEIKQNILC